MASIVTENKSILSDRQTDYLPSDLITVRLDANDVAMLNGKDSYLHFTVVIENGNQIIGSSPSFKANLDPAGGSSYALIDHIQIWNGDESCLIENLDEVATWVGIQNYYYRTEGLDNIRNLLQGSSNNPQNSDVQNVVSPYFDNTTLGKASPQKVEVCLPLPMSGIFGSDNMFPVMACQGGLVIKIFLAEEKKAIQGVMADGFVLQRDGTDREPQINDLPFDTAGSTTGVVGEPLSSQSLPQTFQLGADIAAGAGTTTVDVLLTAAGGIAAPLVAGPLANMTNLRRNVYADAATGNVVSSLCISGSAAQTGSTIYYVDDAGVIIKCGRVVGIADLGGGILRFTTTAFTATVATAANFLPVWSSLLLDDSASFRISNFELIASTVENSPEYVKEVLDGLSSKGGLEVTIKSQNLYKTNQKKGDVKTQYLLPTTERRARALMQAQIYPGLSWHTSAAVPLSDELSAYQYIIANKNVPNRRVAMNKEFNKNNNSWNAIADAERVKCLRASKIDPLKETHPSGCPIYGREVAKSGFYADLNNNDVRLTLDWGCPDGIAAVTVLPQKDKLLYTYVRHFRDLILTNDSCTVEY